MIDIEGYMNSDNVMRLTNNKIFRDMWADPNNYGIKEAFDHFQYYPDLKLLTMQEIEWAMNVLTAEMRDLFLRIEYEK